MNLLGLIALWRTRAEEQDRLAKECENEGHSVWSNGHSGRAAAYRAYAEQLEEQILEELKSIARYTVMEIKVDVPDGKSNDWRVETFIVKEDDFEMKLFNLREMFNSGRYISPGTYKRLVCNGDVVMSNTPAEIIDHIYFIERAKAGSHILINGLGLGVCLKAILESDKVESVTVIENSEDVINLVAPSFAHDKRVNIVHADAFTWKPPKHVRYSCVWHDIWPTICTDNLEEMAKLHRKYGKKCDWQGSWCKELTKYHKRRGY